MMYGLSMSIDGSLELFNITSTMIDGIIKDINYYAEKAIVSQTEKEISIRHENTETIYFYDKDDRKEKVLSFLNVH